MLNMKTGLLNLNSGLLDMKFCPFEIEIRPAELISDIMKGIPVVFSFCSSL